MRVQNYQDYEAQFGEWPNMCPILRREIVSGGEDCGYSQQTAGRGGGDGGPGIGAGVVHTRAHKVLVWS